ncbi:DNA repair family protein [Trichodelitschia bisporula]|uniref:DNA repair family protein n=1 Tax=Trichodelitschia bisporula TaxID=703511 RepID=A0A6G1HX28_9PEZI|nr:DNA repair family protein [Trichodelitschia bisporula]
MSKKRTLDGFFKPIQSKQYQPSTQTPSDHRNYPFPIPHLPPALISELGFAPTAEGKVINDQPDLDLLYFQPYIPKEAQRELFRFLRANLPFYRVQYTIKRAGVDVLVNTPRYTSVFGIDPTSIFSPDGELLDAVSRVPVPKDRYMCRPRPLPACLDFLRTIVEGTTKHTYNFCLVNYYAGGEDSIAFHSDDERFLGKDPAIASLSLGARRDFFMKRKAALPGEESVEAEPFNLPLGSGDLILMRGPTQAKWLHSVPKRKGGESEKGRINITFRRAMAKGGTENYYQYNVGTGRVYRWNEEDQKMVPWIADPMSSPSSAT